MPIPSYDDLTPSIPDVSVRDTFAHVRRILPRDAAPTGPPAPIERDAAPARLHPRLFACLRASDSPELRRASEASRVAAPGGGSAGASDSPELRRASEASRVAAPGGGSAGA